MASAGAETTLPEEAMSEIQQAQQLKNRSAALQNQIEELSAEASEHARVIETLEGVEGSRTCFRLVGEMLVERKAEQVLPELKENLQRILKACQTMDEQRKTFEKEASDILQKHSGQLQELGKRRLRQE